eukprot:COSAG01_NODE_2615_length_7380_cov_4.124159_4_plen_149_part_00
MYSVHVLVRLYSTLYGLVSKAVRTRYDSSTSTTAVDLRVVLAMSTMVAVVEPYEYPTCQRRALALAPKPTFSLLARSSTLVPRSSIQISRRLPSSFFRTFFGTSIEDYCIVYSMVLAGVSSSNNARTRMTDRSHPLRRQLAPQMKTEL